MVRCECVEESRWNRVGGEEGAEEEDDDAAAEEDG